MALEEILEAIAAEADDEVRQILADAEQRAHAIVAEANTEAAAEAERLSHSKDDAAEVTARRITSRAHLDAARARRAARESIYDDALRRAREGLEEVRATPGYDDMLRRLIAEALGVVPDAQLAQVDESDVDAARHHLAEAGSSARVEAAPVPWGGVILTADGCVVHNDLESRLRRANQHLRFIAGDMLPALRGGSA